MGQYYNNYPLVLLSGWNGWGEHDSIDAKGQFPYWNFFTSGDLIAHLEEKGFEVFHPSLGPWNSGWDRACILWAYLFGGRVDYGKVHAEKYGHARYGRTYPGVLKDLGQEGPHKKINIFGHSFGGPTVKEIANLFVNGSEEERAGTPADELSPLFEGGHGNLIHSAHTLSGVNNGTALASMFGKRGAKIFYDVLLGINTVIGDTPLMRGVDLMTQQWGIMPEVEDITGWNWRSPFAKAAEIRNYNRNDGFDHVMHEMQVEVVQTEINPNQKEGDTVLRPACGRHHQRSRQFRHPGPQDEPDGVRRRTGHVGHDPHPGTPHPEVCSGTRGRVLGAVGPERRLRQPEGSVRSHRCSAGRRHLGHGFLQARHLVQHAGGKP